jgi:hypothetical protein
VIFMAMKCAAERKNGSLVPSQGIGTR